MIFHVSELVLTFAMHHFYKCLAVYVSQFIFREYKVVARINVSVAFHYTGMSASLCHRAYTGLLTHPVGQGIIEYLHIVFADIFCHPLNKESTEKVPPLFRSD